VPYWDLNAPISDTTKDSSAAAIASSALLDLARLVKEKNTSKLYNEIAWKILESLTKNYLTKGWDKPGILMHGCLDKHLSLAIDSCTIFGDYYFDNVTFNKLYITHTSTAKHVY